MKYYFRISFSWFLFLLIPITIISLALYFLIATGFDLTNWGSICAFISLCLFIFFLIGNCYFHITFNKLNVSITGDISPKDEKIQYKCSVKYEDITGIDLIMSSNDSRNKKIKLAWISSMVPKSYIEIKTNDKTERFCVTYYGGWQKKQLVNEIKKRCAEIGNNIEAEDTEVMYQNYLKKKKAVNRNFGDKNNKCD